MTRRAVRAADAGYVGTSLATGVAALEHAVRQPSLSQVLPDVPGRVQLGRSRRQEEPRDVGRDYEVPGRVPACLVEDENRVALSRHMAADLVKVWACMAKVSAYGITIAAPASGMPVNALTVRRQSLHR